jgi:nitrous oxide reductase
VRGSNSIKVRVNLIACSSLPFGTKTALQDSFDGTIRKPSQAVNNAAEYKQGLTQTTAKENLDRATEWAVDSMKVRVHASTQSLERLTENESTTARCVANSLEHSIQQMVGK